MDILTYVLPVAAVLFLLLQMYPIFKAWQMKGQVVQLEDLEALGADVEGRLLIYFFAPRCGMCRTTTPIVDALLAERSDIVKVDASQHLDLAKTLHVMATPAFALLNHGKVENLWLGIKTRRQLLQLLDGK